jgi:lysozyme
MLNTLTPGIFLDKEAAVSLPKEIAIRAISNKGIQLTKTSEGFRGYLYNDGARYCTIAYGHLVKKAPCDGTEPVEFRHGLSEPVGAQLLTTDMVVARGAVTALGRINLTDGQYGALCDFVYNVGVTNFSSSTLLKAVNKNELAAIPTQFRRWVLAGGKKLSGLKVRREQENALFFEDISIPKGLPPAEEETSLIDIRRGEQER